MNILVIATSPFFIVRGTPIRARFFVEAYLKNRYSVDVLTYPVGEDILKENINTYRPKASFYKKKSAGPSISKLFIDLLVLIKGMEIVNKKKYDIIHCVDSEAALIGILLKSFSKRKVISDFHNRLSDNLKIHKWGFLAPIARLIEGFLYKKSDYIIANSKDFMTYLKRKYRLKNIDYALDILSDKEEKPKIPLPINYIVYSGNSQSYQGVPLLIESFSGFSKKFKNIKLVLIGNIEQDIKKLISKHKLNKQVILTGVLSIENTNYFLKRSIFNIIPRVSGVQPGMKALHYLGAKNAILATNVKGNRVYLEHLQNSYLVAPKVDELIKGMELLATDKKLRKKIIENIIRTNEQQDLAQKLKKIVDKLK